jgi:heme exporter protein CcmD
MVEGRNVMNLHDLFAMGNYGTYVWSAYGITLAVFSLNVFLSYREQKKVRKIYQQYQMSAKAP